jgi:hypothetical protein
LTLPDDDRVNFVSHSKNARRACVNDKHAELDAVTVSLEAFCESVSPTVVGDVIRDQIPAQIASSHRVVTPR